MIAKRALLVLLLLLSCGTSFALPNENLHLDEQETLVNDFEFDEKTVDLYQATVPFFKTNPFQECALTGSKNLLLQSPLENQSQEDYLRRSKDIDPGLDVSTIIFPFHVFL